MGPDMESVLLTYLCNPPVSHHDDYTPIMKCAILILAAAACTACTTKYDGPVDEYGVPPLEAMVYADEPAAWRHSQELEQQRFFYSSVPLAGVCDKAQDNRRLRHEHELALAHKRWLAAIIPGNRDVVLEIRIRRRLEEEAPLREAARIASMSPPGPEERPTRKFCPPAIRAVGY